MRLPLMPNDTSLKESVAYSFALVPELAKTIEPVGKFYALLQGKVMRDAQREAMRQGKTEDEFGNKLEIEDSGGEEGDQSQEDEEEKGEEGSNDYEKKKKKKTKAEIEKEAMASDHYKILNITDHVASEVAITKAFRKMALTWHPDKLGKKSNANTKKIWLQIQTAYDVLTDVNKRKKYDSSLPFDDKLPRESEIKTPEAFFELFKKCFETNAKFAVVKPIPDIGDINTSMDEVYKFYRYWDNFKTWREFSQYDEYDTEDAQDRYEKRWMEQQNKKGRKVYEKDERKRLIKMATRCYQFDPRIKAALAAEADAKVAAKEAKKNAKKLQWVDVEKKKQDDIDAKQALIDEAKQKDLDIKLARKLKNQLYRATVKTLAVYCVEMMPGTNYDRFYVDELVKKYPQQDVLEVFIAKVKALDAPVGEEFIHAFLMLVDAKAQLLKIQKAEEAKIRAEQKKKDEANVQGDWTNEELDLFTKAIVRFPTGTGNRWQVIADYIGTRSQKLVIAKAKEIQAKKQAEVDAKRQEEADKEARIEGYKKEAQIKARNDAQKEQQEKKDAANKKAAAPVAAAVNPNAWTKDQQAQMEKGMKEFTTKVAIKERWVKISQLVDGKTPKQCHTRFKELCAAAKSAGAQ